MFSSKTLIIFVIIQIIKSEYIDDYSSSDTSDSNEIIDESNTNSVEDLFRVTVKPEDDRSVSIQYKDNGKEIPLDEIESIITDRATTSFPPFRLPKCSGMLDTPSGNAEEKCINAVSSFPYTVSIQRKGAHYASGALIHSRWILSCAGEFYNSQESMKLFRVRLGSLDCKKGGILVPLARVDIHPAYKYGKPNFDVAILKLAKAVRYSETIRPVDLTQSRTQARGNYMATYWPRLIVKGTILPMTAKERTQQNSMRVSAQRSIPHEKCEKMIKSQNITLHNSTICLKPVLTHHSKCMPDAGAPVLFDDGLWGVTSSWTSKQCNKLPSPTVFTQLSSPIVRVWLERYLRSGEL